MVAKSGDKMPLLQKWQIFVHMPSYPESCLNSIQQCFHVFVVQKQSISMNNDDFVEMTTLLFKTIVFFPLTQNSSWL